MKRAVYFHSENNDSWEMILTYDDSVPDEELLELAVEEGRHVGFIGDKLPMIPEDEFKKNLEIERSET